MTRYRPRPARRSRPRREVLFHILPEIALLAIMLVGAVIVLRAGA